MPDDEPREDEHKPDDGSVAPAPPSDEVAAAVLERFPDAVFHDSHGQAVVYVGREAWHDVAAFLRDEQQFTQCVDVTAVDQLVAPARAIPAAVDAERFEVELTRFLSDRDEPATSAS